MAKSAQQLFREGKDPNQIGNPRLRQQVRRLQEQNYQAQLNQVNANYQAWRADNAGVPISDYFSQVNAQYTVKDGDTLPTIAANAGTTVPDLLNANPDMTAPATGMVINAPRPRPAQNRPSNQPGGIGLPSNAALGATTTNPQGYVPLQAQPTGAEQRMRQFGQVGQGISNFFGNMGTSGLQGLNQMRQIQMGQPLGGVTASQQFGQLRTQAGQGLDALRQAQMGQTPRPTTPAGTTPPLTPGQPDRSNRRERPQSYMPDVYARTRTALIQRVSNPDYTPNAIELQTLKNLGLIKPSDPKANGGMNGNYSYGAFRRRGGGGGGGRAPAWSGVQHAQQYNPDYNDPAFSGGGGFRGLVNWRI